MIFPMIDGEEVFGVIVFARRADDNYEYDLPIIEEFVKGVSIIAKKS